MESKSRSLIFKINEANLVDMAMSDVVVDNYIMIDSGILFHKGHESDLAVNEVFESQQFSGFNTSDSRRKDKASSRFMP